MDGVNEVAHELTYKDFLAWEQATSRVLYCLVCCVHNQMLGYINDAKLPKDAGENMKKVFAASIMARKLQLRQDLNNIQQRDMLVADYTSKIKDICDSLGSTNVALEEDKMVQICLGGLKQRFRSFRTAICTRARPPSFFDLHSMLMVEENHVGMTRRSSLDNHMLYIEVGRPRGCTRRC